MLSLGPLIIKSNRLINLTLDSQKDKNNLFFLHATSRNSMLYQSKTHTHSHKKEKESDRTEGLYVFE
jgi:hypothetical protein